MASPAQDTGIQIPVTTNLSVVRPTLEGSKYLRVDLQIKN